MLFIAFLLYFFLSYRPILASDRNIFGLHLTQLSDIDSAAPIINSAGGNWGWATIVIRPDQLDCQAWQDFFDKCRLNHIIPIVRLATISQDGYWKKPDFTDIDNLANFLDSLNWPVSDQYIVIFNEINHADEWGGEVDIKNYTDLAIYTIQKFKQLNSRFYLLGSALDLAAPEKPPLFKSASNTYREIFLYRPQYFDLIDGLASHSYPNHGFVGTPNDTGQHSIMGYSWEISYLKNLGIKKNYSVFITETGWPHREGETSDNNFYTTSTTAKFLLDALTRWQSDPKIMAITPFIFNYPHEPFDHFSWVNTVQTLYPAYQQIIDSPKFQNTPAQIVSYQITKNRLPFIIFTGNEYVGHITLKNNGQSIWGEQPTCLIPQTTPNVTLDAICLGHQLIVPGQSITISYKFTIGDLPEYKEKTLISWQNLPLIEITPLNGSATIYSPRTGLFSRLLQFFHNLFI